MIASLDLLVEVLTVAVAHQKPGVRPPWKFPVGMVAPAKSALVVGTLGCTRMRAEQVAQTGMVVALLEPSKRRATRRTDARHVLASREELHKAVVPYLNQIRCRSVGPRSHTDFPLDGEVEVGAATVNLVTTVRKANVTLQSTVDASVPTWNLENTECFPSTPVFLPESTGS